MFSMLTKDQYKKTPKNEWKAPVNGLQQSLMEFSSESGEQAVCCHYEMSVIRYAS